VTVHGFVLAELSQFNQLPNVDEPVGVAVSVTRVPLPNWLRQGVGLAQLRPNGELVTVPAPLPANVRVRTGDVAPPLLLPVKQTTFAVM